LQNEGFKELIIKLGVDPNDKAVIDTIIQGSQSMIQSLRQQLKIPASDDVQTNNLSQVESEKEILQKELIERKYEVLALRIKVTKLNRKLILTFVL